MVQEGELVNLDHISLSDDQPYLYTTDHHSLGVRRKLLGSDFEVVYKLYDEGVDRESKLA